MRVKVVCGELEVYNSKKFDWYSICWTARYLKFQKMKQL